MYLDYQSMPGVETKRPMAYNSQERNYLSLKLAGTKRPRFIKKVLYN